MNDDIYGKDLNVKMAETMKSLMTTIGMDTAEMMEEINAYIDDDDIDPQDFADNIKQKFLEAQAKKKLSIAVDDLTDL